MILKKKKKLLFTKHDATQRKACDFLPKTMQHRKACVIKIFGASCQVMCPCFSEINTIVHVGEIKVQQKS